MTGKSPVERMNEMSTRQVGAFGSSDRERKASQGTAMVEVSVRGAGGVDVLRVPETARVASVDGVLVIDDEVRVFGMYDHGSWQSFVRGRFAEEIQEEGQSESPLARNMWHPIKLYPGKHQTVDLWVPGPSQSGYRLVDVKGGVGEWRYTYGYMCAKDADSSTHFMIVSRPDEEV